MTSLQQTKKNRISMTLVKHVHDITCTRKNLHFRDRKKDKPFLLFHQVILTTE